METLDAVQTFTINDIPIPKEYTKVSTLITSQLEINQDMNSFTPANNSFII